LKASIHYQDQLIATDIAVANDFWTRLSGYMFRAKPHVAGILFEPSGAIQTSFMNFNLDVVFLSQENRVVKVLRNVKPWRLTRSYHGSHRTLEMPSGILPSELKDGDVLQIDSI
jgi:uncharacterized membrane protein (UPF0127 family)